MKHFNVKCQEITRSSMEPYFKVTFSEPELFKSSWNRLEQIMYDSVFKCLHCLIRQQCKFNCKHLLQEVNVPSSGRHDVRLRYQCINTLCMHIIWVFIWIIIKLVFLYIGNRTKKGKSMLTPHMYLQHVQHIFV